jgi:hypothetical protein
MWLAGILAWALLAVPTSPAAYAAPDSYAPPAGVKFNDPYGREYSKYAIRRHIIRTINSTEAGTRIRIAAWNIRGPVYRDALIAAHRRGVSVGVIIDRSNANEEHANPEVDAVERAFAGSGNSTRAADLRSFVKKCVSSCRGTRGIPHMKLFMFERAGGVSYVTMWGSNNATDVAVNDQWNDLYTTRGNLPVYRDMMAIFTQMVADTPLASPYRRFNYSGMNLDVYPYQGNVPSADPDLKKLQDTRCKGATGRTGKNGRTVVRMAQDALLGERGQLIANRLVTMKRRGCNIRIVYSLMGRKIRSTLRAAGVPMLQYSYDRNRDGYYDIYLHMKVMTISGVYRGVTNTRVTFNGTANWSPVALGSDELVGTLYARRLERRYEGWINYLFTHRPSSWSSTNLAPVSYADVEGRGVRYDPWAKVKEGDL